MLVSRNWLKEYLGDACPSANEIEELLTFHSFEIEGVERVGDDEVIDVDVLPNRSSDCLCHRGIARELATVLDVRLENDPLQKDPDLTKTEKIKISVKDTHTCPRFSASLITNVTVKESPKWLQDRLIALGQRPINNIVDATNYVMYAIGQPVHAYDAGKFPQTNGVWKFGVRYAKEGETISLLAEGGKNEDRIVELTGSELLIVDASSDTPIGLAGVKGGRFAVVDESTTDILIEAAHFDPSITRKTARRLGIVIDASKRFENEPSRELPLYAQHDIATLIADIAEGTYQGTVDEYFGKKENPKVTVNPKRVNALLGISLSIEEMEAILKRVGVLVETEGELLLCTGPWERTDLNIEVDFIEEIGRIYGFDKIPSVVPDPVKLTELNKRHYYSEKIRNTLLNLGFSEVITSSFRKKDKIKLQNAFATDKAYMRSNLTKGITEALDKNSGFLDLLGIDSVRIFEIGTVFSKTDTDICEHTSIALGVRTKVSGYTPKDDAALQDVIEILEKELGVSLNATIDKAVAEINLTNLLDKLPEPQSYQEVPPAPAITYKPFSLYPAITRDISMWVTQGTDVGEIEQVLKETAGDLCVRISHIDEFSKEGRTSHAFRLVFQADDKTLTDDEVNTIMDGVYKKATDQGWETR